MGNKLVMIVGQGTATMEIEKQDKSQDWAVDASYKQLNGGPLPKSVDLRIGSSVQPIPRTTEKLKGQGNFVTVDWTLGNATNLLVHLGNLPDMKNGLLHVGANSATEVFRQILDPSSGPSQQWKLTTVVEPQSGVTADVTLRTNTKTINLPVGKSTLGFDGDFAAIYVSNLSGPGSIKVQFELDPA